MAQEKITFHNKVGANFESYHVDGGFGGITPKGYIHVSFYSERFPIPKSTDFQILEKNSVGEKISDSEDSLKGILRQHHVGIFMDLAAAKNLIQFLNKQVDELERIRSLKTEKNG
jgi:hypothetical protein